jgi:pyrimidine operon attenuation protein/uracil phosphoribosyltransferase
MNATGSRVLILDAQRIERKLLRMAWQIWEHNSEQSSVTLIGIAGSGTAVARKLAAHLQAISPLTVTVLELELSKKSPLEAPITLTGAIRDSSLVLVDDVANSGRTLLYALKPILDAAPEKILIAVLVDRKHKSFPVNPDIIGHQVATTLQENIIVTLTDGSMAAYLE